MIRKYLLPILAIVGFSFAMFMVSRGNRVVPAAEPVNPPPQTRFTRYVSAAGLVEAASDNIAIGTPVSGLITAVKVKVGDQVKAGQVLFQPDDRQLKAQLLSQEAGLRVAGAQVAKLTALPRAEDLPPLTAKVAQQKVNLEDLRAQLARLEGVKDPRSVSQDEVIRHRFSVQTAEKQMEQAEAQLAQLKSGAWQPDLDVARAQEESARAGVEAIRIELERLKILAPIDAEVLQVQIQPGEFAQAGTLAVPLMVLGDTSSLHVRVDVDENDAWRVQADAPAVAFLRGNRQIKTSLKFVRFEPYVVPKKSLTGDSIERVDTRVLQVIYSIEHSGLPIFAGQQMDVFIEALDQAQCSDRLPQTEQAETSKAGP